MSTTEPWGNDPARRSDSPAPGAVVEAAGVSRSFGTGATAVHAVREVTCRVPAAARIAVTGPSGSGKSSLLHLLAGLDTPTSGTVRWPGLPMNRRGRPAAVGVVFQGPSLIPSLDVTENVAAPLIFAGQGAGPAMRQATAALDLVGIGDLATKLPDELSGGQAQRVAIARVLASRPSLILADEPTGQLDHHTGNRVVAVLLDAAASIGAAVIVSTHDAVVADQFGVRWRMRDGRLDTGDAATDPTPPELTRP